MDNTFFIAFSGVCVRDWEGNVLEPPSNNNYDAAVVVYEREVNTGYGEKDKRCEYEECEGYRLVDERAVAVAWIMIRDIWPRRYISLPRLILRMCFRGARGRGGR
jgi:hypothetical protein